MRKYFLLLSIIIIALSGCKKNQVATQAQIDDEKIQLYLKTNNLTMTKDPSGIYYQILVPGTGPYPVGPSVTSVGSTVQVAYSGSYLNGQVFQAYQTDNRLVSGYSGGFAYVLTLINKGGRIKCIIPSALGYGPDGDSGGSIPPNAVLVFTIDMIGFY